MASITALELVNRVLRRMRQDTVSSFSGNDAQVILDYVNAAKEDVLTSRDWQFDLRHDGAIVTSRAIATTAGRLALYSTTHRNADSDVDGYELAPNGYVGSLVTRFEYQGDSTAAFLVDEMVGSVWRLQTLRDPGTTFVIDGPLDTEWTGPATTTALLKYFVAEYLFPDTVREITSVTNAAGSPLRLEAIDPAATFEAMFPDPAGRFGDPQWVGVGGYALNTYNPTLAAGSAGGELEPRLRMVLYPVPENEIRLTYSYYYNHPELVNTTDVLEGVPPNVVSDIVLKAHADAIQGIEHRVIDGINMGRMAEGRVASKYATQDAQPARRHVVRSWEGGNRRRSVLNGFPGVTIEE